MMPARSRAHLSPRLSHGLKAEDGSALLLTIFYGFLSLVLIFLVVAATSLYLERKRLFTLADGAALVGAESYALDDVVLTAPGFRPTLTPQKVASWFPRESASRSRLPRARYFPRASTSSGRCARIQRAFVQRTGSFNP